MGKCAYCDQEAIWIVQSIEYRVDVCEDHV